MVKTMDESLNSSLLAFQTAIKLPSPAAGSGITTKKPLNHYGSTTCTGPTSVEYPAFFHERSRFLDMFPQTTIGS